MVLNTYLKKDESLKMNEKASKVKKSAEYIMTTLKLKSRIKIIKDSYRNKLNRK